VQVKQFFYLARTRTHTRTHTHTHTHTRTHAHTHTHRGWQKRRVVVTGQAILFFKDGSQHTIDKISLHEIEDITLGSSQVCS